MTSGERDPADGLRPGAIRLPESGVRRAAADILDVFRQHLRIDETQRDAAENDLSPPRRETFAPGEVEAMIEHVGTLPAVQAPPIEAGLEEERMFVLLELSRGSHGLARQLATRELRQLIDDLPLRADLADSLLAHLGEQLAPTSGTDLPVLLQVLGDAARRELERRGEATP